MTPETPVTVAPELQGLKVGDEVHITSRTDRDGYIAKVTKINRKTFLVGDDKFSLETCRSIDGSWFDRRYARIPTDEDRAALRRRAKIVTLGKVKWSEMEESVLDGVLVVLAKRKQDKIKARSK